MRSIRKAASNYAVQVFVVDNDSGDDSIVFTQAPSGCKLYVNKDNLGFGKANNQAIKQAKGDFTLIINPDTLVSEDTFSSLIAHMNAHPDCGNGGCKFKS